MEKLMKNVVSRFIGGTLEPRHFDPNIKVTVKSHYGTDHIYITSEHSEAVTALTGKKTLTENDMRALKALGFHVTQIDKRTF